MSGARGGATYSAGPALQDMSVIADGGGHSWALHVTAHPGSRDNATPMRACLNIVDTAEEDGDGVALPAATGGQMCYVINRSGYAIDVYTSAGTTDTIYASDGPAPSMMTLPSAAVAMFVSTPGQWSITSAPPDAASEVEEAPQDGAAYVRSMASWLNADARYVIPQPGTVTPAMDGTGAPGASLLYARQDHVHPTDSSRYAAANPANYINIIQARTGVTDGSDASPGAIGEYRSAQLLSTAPIALTNSVDTTIITLQLTAGDWDAWGSVGYLSSGTNNNTWMGWLTTSTSRPSIDQMGGLIVVTPSNNTTQSLAAVSMMRVSTSSPVTLTLGANAAFTAGTVSAFGKIMARRRR